MVFWIINFVSDISMSYRASVVKVPDYSSSSFSTEGFAVFKNVQTGRHQYYCTLVATIISFFSLAVEKKKLWTIERKQSSCSGENTHHWSMFHRTDSITLYVIWSVY